MISQLNRKFFITPLALLSGLILFISNSAFTNLKTSPDSNRSSDKKNVYSNEINLNHLYFSGLWLNISASSEYKKSNTNTSVKTPTDMNLPSPYFHKRYIGNGVDHMNINLVNLSLTGLMVGDEIGVFDGEYCVGLAVVEEKNIQESNISIPSSANDTIDSDPSGFIEGHKITLKVYRNGTVFQLHFQTVNNSSDIFEKGGSMFALINFARSIRQTTIIRKK